LRALGKIPGNLKSCHEKDQQEFKKGWTQEGLGIAERNGWRGSDGPVDQVNPGRTAIIGEGTRR